MRSEIRAFLKEFIYLSCIYLIAILGQLEDAFKMLETKKLIHILANTENLEDDEVLFHIKRLNSMRKKPDYQCIEGSHLFTHGMDAVKFVYAISKIMGLPEKEIYIISLATMLHDIGKCTIDQKILNKPGRLTEDEWVEMRKHPQSSYELIMPLKTPALLALYHHERYDGKGYIHGLSKEDIPLGSRIISAADACKAMTTPRSYNKVMTMSQAIDELMSFRGTQFDPDVVDIFCKYLRIGKLM